MSHSYNVPVSTQHQALYRYNHPIHVCLSNSIQQVRFYFFFCLLMSLSPLFSFSPADRSCPRGILQGLWFNHRWGSECVGQESNPHWLWWLHQTLLPRQIWHRYGKHYWSAVDFFISVLLKMFALFLWTGLSTEKTFNCIKYTPME